MVGWWADCWVEREGRLNEKGECGSGLGHVAHFSAQAEREAFICFDCSTWLGLGCVTDILPNNRAGTQRPLENWWLSHLESGHNPAISAIAHTRAQTAEPLLSLHRAVVRCSGQQRCLKHASAIQTAAAVARLAGAARSAQPTKRRHSSCSAAARCLHHSLTVTCIKQHGTQSGSSSGGGRR